MPEPLRPAATKAFTRRNWIFVPTIASATLAPTVAEMTGASALDFTRIMFGNGTALPSQTTNRVSAERRYGDGEQYEFIGITTLQGGEMLYQLAPQAASGSDGKKMWEKIPAGTTGFLVDRLGLGRATDVAAGQFVTPYPVEFGPSLPTTIGDGEAAEAAAMCTYAVTGPPPANRLVAVLA